jgi:HPt (histidine-containing phosphotransfer) domain-containing protein
MRVSSSLVSNPTWDAFMPEHIGKHYTTSNRAIHLVGRMSGLKVIDWEEAMNQVGGDEEFLNEVLDDLLAESQTAEDEIGTAIQSTDFAGVMKAAHRIKGSASYLCCEQLRDISLRLQDEGHAAAADPSDTAGSLAKIETMYAEFVETLKTLRAEIAARK